LWYVVAFWVPQHALFHSCTVNITMLPVLFTDMTLLFIPIQCCRSDNDLLAESSSESEDTDADASTDSEAEHVEQQSVQLGPAYQAKLPQLQQRPACPTAAEAKFLTAPIYTPAAEHQQQQEQANHALALPPGQFHAQWVAASSGAARLQLLQQWLQHSDEAMGQGMAEVRWQVAVLARLRTTYLQTG
jgi:hypothetical protein